MPVGVDSGLSDQGTLGAFIAPAFAVPLRGPKTEKLFVVAPARSKARFESLSPTGGRDNLMPLERGSVCRSGSFWFLRPVHHLTNQIVK